MRHHEPGLVDHGIAEEQQVEIERQREEIAALSDRIDRLTRALDALVELRPSS